MSKKGVLLLIILVLICCGIGPAWNLLKSFATGMWEFIKALPQLIIAIAPLTDLGDWIKSRIIFVVIVCVLSWAGFVLSKRDEKKLLAIISGIVGIISTISLLLGLGS